MKSNPPGLPVFYKRKLLGYYTGEVLGDDFCHLTYPEEIAEGMSRRVILLAEVLFDEKGRKAGLELYWREGLEALPGFRSK